jgi:hypothetical protein
MYFKYYALTVIEENIGMAGYARIKNISTDEVRYGGREPTAEREKAYDN